MSEKIVIDMSDLTLGELEEFEKLSGVTLEETQGGRVSPKAVIALVFLSKRRVDPKFSLRDARDVKLSDISFASDPTTATPEQTT